MLEFRFGLSTVFPSVSCSESFARGDEKFWAKFRSEIDGDWLLSVELEPALAESNWTKMDEEFEKFRTLSKCLSEHGCDVGHLELRSVPGAGRGLVAVKTIRPNSCILRLTESVLITSATVLNSSVEPAIARFPGTLNSFDALCLFLMSEATRKSVSPWRPFLDVLPDEESVLAFAFTVVPDRQDEASRVLPPRCRAKFEEQLGEIDSCRRRVIKVWSEAKRIHGLDQAIDGSDEKLFRWAWSCVNSRCIYKDNPSPSPLLNNAEGDAIAMAPFLDMLNHSANTKVECGFSSKTRTFDVFTAAAVAEGHEACICYGLHTNSILLLEYGFVLDDNPNNAVYLDHSDLKRLCLRTNVVVGEKHWKVLSDSKLPCPLYQTEAEPPWTFMASMKILTMKEDDLANWSRIYDCASFDEEAEVVILAKTIVAEYLSELESSRPTLESLHVFPKRFHSMIMQVWQDDIAILSDSLAYINQVLNEQNAAEV